MATDDPPEMPSVEAEGRRPLPLGVGIVGCGNIAGP